MCDVGTELDSDIRSVRGGGGESLQRPIASRVAQVLLEYLAVDARTMDQCDEC